MREYKLADVRFNGGNGALLCNKCSIIIAYGHNHEDKIHYCKRCEGAMKERVRELAEQAGLDNHLWLDIPNSEDVKVTEKFAELIIRECLKQGDALANYYIDNHSEHDQAMLLASIADYSEAIKQHFGVG